MTIQWIHEWNRMGGAKIFIDPGPEAIGQWKKMKRAAEKRYIRSHRKRIRQNRISLFKAIKEIWKS